ncbi:Protein CBG25702 [Caenorhabditis briggsae]|uniref:Protein CBG25702 n=1 Tax=Caenorhabditis briggsae TaxID=6238 RepID=B6IGW5_CAEBR|nr:Protein CBG25702 [Caenorhabditis briggsae]CAR99145.1 Protein CBG25702 [Caenorhabditis briggsae]
MSNEYVPVVVHPVPEELKFPDQIHSVTQLEPVPLDAGLSEAAGDNSWGLHMEPSTWTLNFPMYKGQTSSDGSPSSSNASYEKLHCERKSITNEEIGARRVRQELKKRKESRRNEKRAIIRCRLKMNCPPAKFEDAVEHFKSSELYNDPYLKKEWLKMTDQERQRWLEKEEAVFEEIKVQLRLGFVTILKYEHEEMDAIKKLEIKNQEDKFWNIFAENLKKYPRHDLEPFPFHIYF